MCRNIRPLHNFAPEATSQEVHDAALQYVRKVSGMTKPSQANTEVFERAVAGPSAPTADHRPSNPGARFSKNAAAPSALSSVV